MTFDITIDGYDGDVADGDPLDVNYTVTNSGSSSETQTIELDVATPATVVDDFSGSSFAGGWTDTSRASIRSDSAAENGYAVYRSAGNQVTPFLETDYGNLAADLEPGGPIAEMRVRADTSGDYIGFDAVWDSGTGAFYEITVGDGFEIWEYDGSGWGYSNTASFNSFGEYVRLVVDIQSNGDYTAQVWSDDGSVKRQELSDTGVITTTGTGWGLKGGQQVQSSRVDWIKTHASHPYE